MVALTEQELRLVKQYVLLPILLTVFERDKKIMQETIKTPGPYIINIEKAMDKVTKDLAQLRQKMRAAGVRVVQQERKETAAVVKTVCRGYENTHNFWWDHLKTETEIKMSEYLELAGKIKDPV